MVQLCRYLTLIFIIALAGCTSTAPTRPSLIDSPDSSQPSTVFVMATSGDLAQGGLQMILALLPEGHNVGATGAQPIPLTSLSDQARRRAFSQRLSKMATADLSDLANALSRAREMLQQAKSTARSKVILWTEGDFTGSRAPIYQELDRFRTLKYSIDVVTTSSTKSDFYSRLAVDTGGKVVKISDLAGFLPTAIDLTDQADKLVVIRENKAVPIASETSRMVTMAFPKDNGALLNGLVHNGKAIPLTDPTVFVYSRRGAGNALSLAHIARPAPGKWQPSFTSTPQDMAILLDSRVVFNLESSTPSGEYRHGEDMNVQFKIKGKDDDLNKHKKGKATVTLVDKKTNQIIKKWELATPIEEGDRLTFSGKTKLNLDDPFKPRRYNLKLKYTYKEGGREWTHEKNQTIKVLPGDKSNRPGQLAETDLAFYPTLVQWGNHWETDQPVKREVTITSKWNRPLSLHIYQPGRSYLKIVPAKVTVPAGGKTTVKLTLYPKLARPGYLDDPLTVAARDGTGGERKFPLSIDGAVYSWNAPEVLQLGKTDRGKEVEATIRLETRPYADFEISSTPLLPLGKTTEPLGLSVAPQKKGRYRLEVKIPKTTPKGRFKGSLQINPKVSGLSSRELPIALEVDPITPQLETVPTVLRLQTKARQKWVELDLELIVRYQYPDEVGIRFQPGDLANTVGNSKLPARLTIRCEAKGNWNGRRAQRNVKYQAKYRVFLSNDLPPGTYKGVLTLDLQGRLGLWHEREVPVEIVVTGLK